jgi:hypothetical protein
MNPKIAEQTNPVAMKGRLRVECRSLGTSTRPAPAIMGIESRKEKRAAERRSNPRRSATQIVMPERETPGMTAKAWATPMRKAAEAVNSESVRLPVRPGE